MKKIVIIGNIANGKPLFDGGRLKTKAYCKLANAEGFLSYVLDIYHWYFHIFRIFLTIKKEINQRSRIVVMAGPNGCRFFIPFVNFLNRKRKTEIVFCPLGIGTLDEVVANLKPQDVQRFLNCEDYFGKKDLKMGKQLRKIDSIIVASEKLKKCYQNFYGLSNVFVMRNFRWDVKQEYIVKKTKKDTLKLCFLARVCENKGILDLMNVCQEINTKTNYKIYLDIFGEMQLNDLNEFNSYLNDFICYKGCIPQADACSTICNYDLFVLPTKYHGEGIPGSIVESLISGTPILSSSFCQINELIYDNYNGFLFEICNKKSLYNKLIFILENTNLLKDVSKNAYNSGKKFLYENNRRVFLEKFCGDKK